MWLRGRRNSRTFPITTMKSKYALAVSDIDGTLAIMGERISDANLAAIRRLQAAGMEFVLASGRHHENMLQFCEMIPGVNWVISAQGGMIANKDQSEVLSEDFMAAGLVSEIARKAQKFGYTPLIYSGEGVCSPKDDEWTAFYAKIAKNVVTQVPLEIALTRSVFKVVWVSGEKKILEVKNLELNFREVTHFQTHPHLYEFMPATTSKGNAVEMLARQKGLEMEQIVSFGDGDNDVSMLERTGCSVAMGHGSDSALAAGKIVTSKDDPSSALADGVNIFFERFYGQV